MSSFDLIIANITQQARDNNWTFEETDQALADYLPSLDAVSPDVQNILIAMYSLTAILSLVGNSLVIIILTFGKRSSVRGYLINLAVSDITMAVFCIPFTYTSFMYKRWIFATWFCPITGFMQHASVTTSIYTLVVIGIDRYNAIVHPLNVRWTKNKVLPTLVSIWTMSMVLSVTQMVVTRAEPYLWGGNIHYECKEVWPSTPNHVYEKVYTLLIFLFTFLLPLVSLAHSYISIVRRMYTHKLPGNADPNRDRKRNISKQKAVNMMMVVVVCFTVCWLPMHILMLIIYFGRHLITCTVPSNCYTYYMGFFISHGIAMANSFMNPIIYCFMSKNFRDDSFSLLRRCSCRRKTSSLRNSDPVSSARTGVYIPQRMTYNHNFKLTKGKSATDLYYLGHSLRNEQINEQEGTVRSSKFDMSFRTTTSTECRMETTRLS